VAVSDYAGPQSIETVAQQLHQLVSQYQDLDNVKSSLEVQIPKEIVMYVEDGRNPDIYTREFVEIVAKQNQILNGRMRAFADFRNILAEQISVAFPELREDVAMVLQDTSGRTRQKLEEAPTGANWLGDGALGLSGPSTASAS